VGPPIRLIFGAHPPKFSGEQGSELQNPAPHGLVGGLSRWRVLLAYTTFQGSSELGNSNDLASPGHARKQPILTQCDKPLRWLLRARWRPC
jgi:hypothetical protein